MFQQGEKSSFPHFLWGLILDLVVLAWSLILCVLRPWASYHNPACGDFRYLLIGRRRPFCSLLLGPVETTPPFLVPMKQKVLMQVSEFLSGEFLGCLLIFPSFCTLFKYELL